MLEHLRDPFKKLIEPIAKALIAMGLTANAVTIIGAVGTIVAAIATGVTGHLFAGSVVLTILVLADSLDGSIAKLTTGGTEFGAFLDSTLDRIADWAVLTGVIIFFLTHSDWWYDSTNTSFPEPSRRNRRNGLRHDLFRHLLCPRTSGIRRLRSEERRRYAGRSAGHHSGGYGHYRSDPPRTMAGHCDGITRGARYHHRFPAYFRGEKTNARRQEDISCLTGFFSPRPKGPTESRRPS